MANLTTAWNDGRLIAALVDAIAPGLCPDHEEMDPEKSYENAAYAMKLAEDWLGVPQVMRWRWYPLFLRHSVAAHFTASGLWFFFF